MKNGYDFGGEFWPDCAVSAVVRAQEESPCQALPCRGVRAEHVVRSEGALLHLNQQKVGTPDLPEQILNQREPRTALSAHLRPVCRTVEIDQVSQRGGYVE